MPARSNEFQRLVFLEKNTLAESARVTESKFLEDSRTATEREVDICIETAIAGHPVLLSIECCDSSRAADVGWVERMTAKHSASSDQHPGTLHLAQVLDKRPQQSRGVRACNSSSTATSLKTRSRRLLASGQRCGGLTYRLKVTHVVARIRAIAERSAKDLILHPESKIITPDGTGSAKSMVDLIVDTDQTATAIARANPQPENRFFTLKWSIPDGPDRGPPRSLASPRRALLVGEQSLSFADCQ